MRENFKEGPLGQGEVSRPGRCQVCGAIGTTLVVPKKNAAGKNGRKRP